MAGSQKNKNQEYLDYVNRTSPKSPMLKNMLLAFLFGGLICVIGQAFGDLYKNVFHMDIENSKTAVSITMVFLGALLTGLDIYPKIAKYAGAGTIVPITGFANSIASLIVVCLAFAMVSIIFLYLGRTKTDKRSDSSFSYRLGFPRLRFFSSLMSYPNN